MIWTRVLVSLLLTAGLFCLAQARPGPDSNYNISVGAPAGFTGPGDVVAFNFWVGLRAYTSATRGTAAINLCDNTGANCSDINTDATTGALSNPGTHGANNCATSGTCLIHTIYDKAGGALDCVQTTAANMPSLNYQTGGPGGNTPAAIFTRANSVVLICGSSAGIGGTQPYTMTAVADRTGTTGSFNTVVNNGSSDVLFNSAANGCGIYAGTVLADTTHCADSSWHAIEGLYNNTSSQITVDGNNTSGTAGAGVSTAGFKLGNGVGGFLDGRFVEGGVINGDKSASFGALNSNIHAFWGF